MRFRFTYLSHRALAERLSRAERRRGRSHDEHRRRARGPLHPGSIHWSDVSAPRAATGRGRWTREPAHGVAGAAGLILSLIHISEPTRLLSISYAVFCL